MTWMTKTFFIRFFLWLIALTVCLRLYGVEHISDGLVAIMTGHVVALIGLKVAERRK